MNSELIWELALFVLVLVGLNFFFHLNITILGSLVLTLGMFALFTAIRSLRRRFAR